MGWGEEEWMEIGSRPHIVFPFQSSANPEPAAAGRHIAQHFIGILSQS